MVKYCDGESSKDSNAQIKNIRLNKVTRFLDTYIKILVIVSISHLNSITCTNLWHCTNSKNAVSYTRNKHFWQKTAIISSSARPSK